jgi:hypothetical protein
MKKVYEFIYPEEDNQSIFTVSKSELLLNPGEIMKVIKNGNIDLECEVIDDNGINKIQLISDSLNLTDYIVLEMQSDIQNVVGDRDSIFKRYGASLRFKNNNMYTGQINIPGVDNIEIKFTSRYSPFYCTNKSVKNDIDHLVTIPDDDINYLIYEHSYRTLIKLKGNGDETTDLPTPTELSNPKTIPYNIQQYVRYSVEYDIIYNAWLKMSKDYGSVSKKLAELVIEKNVKLPDLDDYLRGIKEKLSQFKLSGVGNAISTFIKGNTASAYPLTSPRRSF